MPNGLGIFIYNDNKYDSGIYKNGNIYGIGRLNMNNGDVYDGILCKGLFNGEGVFYQKELQ